MPFKDPDKARAYNRARMQRDRDLRPERQRAANRRWVAAHPEDAKDAHSKWRNKNIEAARARCSKWKRDNRVLCALYERLRRARKRASGGTCTIDQLRARIDMFGGCCWMCLRKGIREPYEVIDHVIPVSKGGTGWPANLRPACGRCNLAKSARNWRFMMLPELLKKLGAE